MDEDFEEALPARVATHPVEYVYRHLEKYHGIAQHVASSKLHKLKEKNGLPADFDLLFHRTGNVYRADDRSFLGSLTTGGKTKGEG